MKHFRGYLFLMNVSELLGVLALTHGKTDWFVNWENRLNEKNDELDQ